MVGVPGPFICEFRFGVRLSRPSVIVFIALRFAMAFECSLLVSRTPSVSKLLFGLKWSCDPDMGWVDELPGFGGDL